MRGAERARGVARAGTLDAELAALVRQALERDVVGDDVLLEHARELRFGPGATSSRIASGSRQHQELREHVTLAVEQERRARARRARASPRRSRASRSGSARDRRRSRARARDRRDPGSAARPPVTVSNAFATPGRIAGRARSGRAGVPRLHGLPALEHLLDHFEVGLVVDVDGGAAELRRHAW